MKPVRHRHPHYFREVLLQESGPPTTHSFFLFSKKVPVGQKNLLVTPPSKQLKKTVQDTG